MDRGTIIIVQLQQHVAGLRDLFFFFVSFVLVPIRIIVSLLGNR